MSQNVDGFITLIKKKREQMRDKKYTLPSDSDSQQKAPDHTSEEVRG